MSGDIGERLMKDLRILQKLLSSERLDRHSNPELDAVLNRIQKAVLMDVTGRVIDETTPSANEEELTVLNEELKATSEELIAANQELVAANEELAAVNEQLRLENTLREKAEEETRKSHQEISDILESITDAFFAVDRDWRFIYVNSEAERLWGIKRENLTGRDLWEVFPEAVDTLFEREYQRAMLHRVAVHFEGFSPVLKRWIDVHAYPFREGLSVYFRDITDRKRSELNLKMQNKRLEILSETANHLLLSDDPGEIIDTVFKKLSDSLEVDVYFNFIYDENKQKLRLVNYFGVPEELAQKYRWLEMDKAICGSALRDRRRIVVESLHEHKDPRTEIARRLGIKAYVCHPLISRGRLIGALSFGLCRRPSFQPEELALMQTICDQVAISLERAHLVDQLEQNTLDLLAANNQLKSEVAVRRRAEEKLRLNESRLEALLRLNQMTGAGTREIAGFVVEEAVRLTGSDIGFVGTVNSDESAMTILSRSKKVLGHCEICRSSQVYDISTSGLWAEAVRSRRPFVANDYASFHPAKKGLPKGHIPLSRIMAIPVFDGDRIVIVAAVANKKEDYDDSDVLQLTLLMSGMWEILQRRKAEKELRLSNERFARSFKASPVMMTINNHADLRFIDVNEAFLKGTGYSRPEVMGHTPCQLSISADDEDQIFELKKLLSEQGAFYNKEVKFRTRDGDIRVGLASADIIYINSEQCLLWAMQDITEKRQLEKEISRLERLNLVGQMAAGIGHEIRNPMTAVRGFLQLLGSRKEYTGYHQYFELMIGELDRANSIITEYLTLARNKPVDLVELNLDSILRVLHPLIAANALNAGVDVEMRLEGVPGFPLNENEIRQLILNLVRNGIEAMPAGGTLSIDTYREKCGKAETVILSVRDQGGGMDEEALEKLGTPFFTTKDNGTGLGLAVCYSIAARHKAVIDVETGPGGTTFRVRFKVSTCG